MTSGNVRSRLPVHVACGPAVTAHVGERLRAMHLFAAGGGDRSTSSISEANEQQSRFRAENGRRDSPAAPRPDAGAIHAPQLIHQSRTLMITPQQLLTGPSGRPHSTACRGAPRRAALGANQRPNTAVELTGCDAHVRWRQPAHTAACSERIADRRRAHAQRVEHPAERAGWPDPPVRKSKMPFVTNPRSA